MSTSAIGVSSLEPKSPGIVCFAAIFLFSELRWVIRLDLDDENFESREVFPVDSHGLNDLLLESTPEEGGVDPSGVISMRLGRDLNFVRWTTVGSSWMNN